MYWLGGISGNLAWGLSISRIPQPRNGMRINWNHFLTLESTHSRSILVVPILAYGFGFLTKLLQTDFGERIPHANVVFHDGSDPMRIHNTYSVVYNELVFRLLEKRFGKGEAVLFARSATAGGQRSALPRLWSPTLIENSRRFPVVSAFVSQKV